MLSIPISVVSLKYGAIIEYHNDPGVEGFQLLRSEHSSSDGQRLSGTVTHGQTEHECLMGRIKKCRSLWLPQTRRWAMFARPSLSSALQQAVSSF